MLIHVRRFDPNVAQAANALFAKPVRSQILGRLSHGEVLTATALRCMVVLFGALLWQLGQADGLAPLAGAIALAAIALGLGLLRPLPAWATPLLDAAAIELLIHATGDAASPLLALPLALVVLGSLASDRRDAFTGGGAGLLVLLVVCLAGPVDHRGIALGMAAAQVAATGIAAWVIGQRGHPARASRQDQALQQRYDEAVRSLDWQRRQLAALSTSATLDELSLGAAELASAIAEAPAFVDFGEQRDGGAAPSTTIAIPSAMGSVGHLRLHTLPTALSRPQREALEHLAALTGTRADTLRATAMLQRQQDAMQALWEATGMVRVAPGLDDTVRDACRRLARALDLDWLALLGPSGHQTIAPLMVVQGRAGEGPRLNGIQLRVAAEAMRTGRPLVRLEADAALALLPVQRANDVPLVLAARGNTAEAGTQALLMVFGDLIAAGMAAHPTDVCAR
ncbi:MAG: hypothetical protein RLZZ387_1572 [Chloroflexota bacterium]|jgi:hypothetical protein